MNPASQYRQAQKYVAFSTHQLFILIFVKNRLSSPRLLPQEEYLSIRGRGMFHGCHDPRVREVPVPPPYELQTKLIMHTKEFHKFFYF